MDAAKDLLKRAVELDSAQRYSEALICYEEGIQNLLRVMGECSEEEKKELRKKAEEYLARAEVLKQEAREGDGDYIYRAPGALESPVCCSGHRESKVCSGETRRQGTQLQLCVWWMYGRQCGEYFSERPLHQGQTPAAQLCAFL
jgi:ElaB/YqjD/DUF883 family membrane-anchored ribosome-binding protein